MITETCTLKHFTGPRASVNGKMYRAMQVFGSILIQYNILNFIKVVIKMKFSNRKQPEKRGYQPIANNSGWGNVKGGYQPEKGQDKPRPVSPKVSSGEDA